jgi:hypothetical protein
MEAASRKGFYLKRWTKVVNVMIYKSPGCRELEKLRIIHLFEADFNLIIGLLLCRRAMYHAAENGWIHRGQYCKPAGECNDAVMLKILYNHIAHIIKTPMGQFECNATACFYRIKHQASSFLKELISELWALLNSIWLLRNEHLHGTADTPLHSIKCLHLISEISLLYLMAPSMLASCIRPCDLRLSFVGTTKALDFVSPQLPPLCFSHCQTQYYLIIGCLEHVFEEQLVHTANIELGSSTFGC